jgi:hypothetical protein
MRYSKAAVCAVVICLFALPAISADAKVKEIQKASKGYDFKAVNKISVPVVRSKDVDFGKVDPERLPKIEAILTKVKKNMRESMVKGSKYAKTSIPFYYKAPNRKPTTLILEYNIDKFDNGNQAKRLLPFGGKAEVKMTVKFINAATKEVVAEVEAKAKAKGGVVAGGTDSEVLWSATNMANADVYNYLKKLTGLTYDFWSGVTKGSKMGIQHSTDVMKEEKREVKKR